MRLETSIANGQVTSSDGTSIGYESFGDGPGVVLVQGAMGTTRNYHQLALAMSHKLPSMCRIVADVD